MCLLQRTKQLRTVARNVSSRDRALVVFARSPVAGKSKTRLIPLLGPTGAAGFQQALCLDALSKAARMQGWLVPYLAVTGQGFLRHIAVDRRIGSFILLRQRGAELGERMENAFRLLLTRHPYVVIIGTDSPELPPCVVRQAFGRLRSYQAVLGPCPDGGYYLLGLRCDVSDSRLKQVFRGVRWGTGWAMRDSLRNMTCSGLKCTFLEMIADVDRPADLRKLFERMYRKPLERRRAPKTWEFLTAGLPIFKGGIIPAPKLRPRNHHRTRTERI